jgi:sec-independent protein translocase protein TatB
MFDIGFSEILIIAVVALIVIGPERLPKVARTLGHLFGRMQRYVNDVKADISREMELDELRRLQATMQEAANSIEQSVNKEISSTESELKDIAAPVAELPAPAAIPDAASVPSADSAAPASQLELGLDVASPATRQP